MNAPCILRQLRVRAEGSRGVLLCSPGFINQPVAAIWASHGPLAGIITEEGWMLVNHPEKGLLGLPLSGKGRTWETQWENLDVMIEICTEAGWTEVHDWALIQAALAHK